MEEQADDLYELMGKKKPAEQKIVTWDDLGKGNEDLAITGRYAEPTGDNDEYTDADYVTMANINNVQDAQLRSRAYSNSGLEEFENPNGRVSIDELEEKLTPEQRRQYWSLQNYLNDNPDEAYNVGAKMCGTEEWHSSDPKDVLRLFLEEPANYIFFYDDDPIDPNSPKRQALILERDLTEAESVGDVTNNFKDSDLNDALKDHLSIQDTIDIGKGLPVPKPIGKMDMRNIDKAKHTKNPSDALSMPEKAAFDAYKRYQETNDDPKKAADNLATILSALRDASRY